MGEEEGEGEGEGGRGRERERKTMRKRDRKGEWLGKKEGMRASERKQTGVRGGRKGDGGRWRE